jgi:hypothetical protein
MGNCVIEIHVTGSHHNSIAQDIDQLAARFVDELKQSHNVTAAFLVSGGEYDLLNESARFPLKPGPGDEPKQGPAQG